MRTAAGAFVRHIMEAGGLDASELLGERGDGQMAARDVVDRLFRMLEEKHCIGKMDFRG